MKTITKTLLFLFALAYMASGAYAQVNVRLTAQMAPPPLPVYVQPPCPVDGYLWEPGYWDYSADDIDYYWVPGVWLAPPGSGLYWTPGYWAFEDGVYGFNTGYWGRHVGFYGGINYGFGYGGVGFAGGEWRNGGFRYNTAVTSVNVTVIHNTYINNVAVSTTVNNRAGFSGQGGIVATPTQQEQEAMREQHVQPTAEQLSHRQAALADKSSFSKLNNGRPVAAAMNRVNGTAFNTHGGVAAATPELRQAAIGARAERNNANRAANVNGEQPKAENAKAVEKKAEKKEERAETKKEQRQQKQAKQAAPKPRPVKEPETRKIP